MSAIFKRDFASFFTSPVGYAVIAGFMFFSGIFFYVQCLYVGTSNMSTVFQSMFFIVLFLIPLITMRTIAEDKKQKTDQALLTSPVSIPSIVVAKFLSALALFALCLCSYLIEGIILSFYAKPDWSVIIGNVFGMTVMASSFVALGVFISSVTESPMVAAVVSFVINVLISLFDTISASVTWEPLTNLLNAISFQKKYANFALGLISLSDVVFFLSIAAVFLFLTERVISRRRWA